MTHSGNDPKTERNEDIVFRHLCGETLTDLGRAYGISVERVRYIVRRAGVTVAESRAAYWDSAMITCECETCGETFERRATFVDRLGARFCSRACIRGGGPPRTWSDEELLEHLRTLSRKLGRTPTANHLIAHSPPSHVTYYERFGSLRAAQKAAGLEPNTLGGPRNGRAPQ